VIRVQTIVTSEVTAASLSGVCGYGWLGLARRCLPTAVRFPRGDTRHRYSTSDELGLHPSRPNQMDPDGR
jgi:hypothetical protein